DGSAAECATPLDRRAVEVRVRHRNPGEPARGAERPHRRVIDVPDAIPEEVAVRRLHEERPLADPDGRRDADAEEPRLLLAHLDAMPARRELLQRGPRLPAAAHVLALVFADGTGARR